MLLLEWLLLMPDKGCKLSHACVSDVLQFSDHFVSDDCVIYNFGFFFMLIAGTYGIDNVWKFEF
jgi:hypothetical protein